MIPLLVVCSSMKPSPESQARSAVRNLCGFVTENLQRAVPTARLADLREDPLPLFDGRLPTEHDAPSVSRWHDLIASSRGLLLGVPAYWGSPSGASKNWFDVLTGPAYDLPDSTTVFTGRPIASFIVGADQKSAATAAPGLVRTIEMVGGRLVGEPLQIANPRSDAIDWETVGTELLSLAAAVLRESTDG